MPRLPQSDDGVCRMCGKPVLREDGTQNLRRTWHRGEPWEERNCVQDYMLHFQNSARSIVWDRDKGVCKACGTQSDFWGGWEADHVVPLADGGSFGLENLQTLCTDHHRDKTARENAVRASTRKRDPWATTS
ncbi:MAG: HNH endonuclease [Acidobacteria bacterium]|nr:HNH endonuclease [Acidobacteriota bacterium]